MENEKGGNAVEATRKQLLGRASERIIGGQSLEVKAVIARYVRGAQPAAAANLRRSHKAMQTDGRFRAAADAWRWTDEAR